jgi:hypothetical protein
MNNDTESAAEATEESTTISQSAVNSSYKILGQFSDTGGAAVLGQNDASSGTPIGVQGAVPNAKGFGLYTEDDAKVGGSLQLTDIVTPTASDNLTLATTGGTFAVATSSFISFDGDPTAGGVLMGANINSIEDGAEGATIGGGGDPDEDVDNPNKVSDNFGTVAGGAGNEAGSPSDDDPNTAPYATVPGGKRNTADGSYSFAAGRQAEANGNDGAFVWGDSSSTTVSAAATDQVRFQASGGFVVENTQQFQITDGLQSGSGTPVEIDSSGLLVKSPNTSSVRYKTNIEPLDPTPGEVLELEPRSFEYEESGEEDVGLLAEEADGRVPELVGYDEEGRPDRIRYDRLAVFLLPEIRRNRERIADLETDESRQSELERKDDRIEELEAKLREKEQRIDDLETRLAAIEEQVGSAAPADD